MDLWKAGFHLLPGNVCAADSGMAAVTAEAVAVRARLRLADAQVNEGAQGDNDKHY
eukprot:CAMPEP_0181470000 /NCGR_PEP_ID=MMETSP1110-20121109/38320_1 /TAXON_ID=174948 /ORGANISM="Symbiodinium sp., Strain CCMP421" /LENGTH=55 /DNA_ID=CAMNT_0023594947 /DNA_START=248 /DNA_END=415 /DNA_ORIENTATION=-